MTSPTGSDQQKILSHLEFLGSQTVVNFPGILTQAVNKSLITPAEKDIITRRYTNLDDRLTTFFLLVSGKDKPDCLDRILSILESTGNNKAASILKSGPSALRVSHDLDNEIANRIMDNLDRLCRHTRNVNMVFTYASGLGLMSGTEREIIMDRCRTTDERLAEFYKLVMGKGASAYDKLIQVLRMTQNNWAVDILRNDDDDDDEDDANQQDSS